MIKTSLLVLCLATFLTACMGENDCGVADASTEIRTLTKNGITYHLYLKMTGLNDKAIFYVLHDAKPSFDVCGRADRAPLAETYIDTTQGQPARVVFSRDGLDIAYADKSGAGTRLDEVELVVP